MLEHGGRVREAAKRYGIPVEDWLDLSTGINPIGFPVPPVAPDDWQRLPEDDDGLEAAAAAYYGAPALPVPGSQAAIQALPRCFPPREVAVLTPCYREHEAAWRRVGHRVAPVGISTVGDVETLAEVADIIVAIQPNNPTGHAFAPDALRRLADRLAARDGLLVVDEAFADAQPELSLARHVEKHPSLVVLRSLGKFFGLAGARVGFVLGTDAIRGAVAQQVGPWAVSGPSRRAAQAALADRGWQRAAVVRLRVDSARLAALLAPFGPGCGTPLFRWLPHPRAAEIHDFLARRGILVRAFTDAATGLRFGLPGGAPEWARLTVALAALRREL